MSTESSGLRVRPAGRREGFPLLLFAPAKINLHLSVGPPRGDGYHHVETVMASISLGDVVELERAEGFRLEIEGADLPGDVSNLALKAALLLHERAPAARRAEGALIRLKKRVPVGAGLGGGSSDAAAVLRGLPLLWDLSVDDDFLLDLAAELGSDVPFSLLGGCMLARGRGDELTPVPLLPECHIVVAAPPFSVSTSWAYAAISGPDRTLRSSQALIAALSAGDLSEIGKRLNNDFEAALLPRYPVLARLKEDAVRAGAAGSCLTGSGSAVYALAAEEEAALSVARAWEDRARVYVARPVREGAAPLMEGVGHGAKNRK